MATFLLSAPQGQVTGEELCYPRPSESHPRAPGKGMFEVQPGCVRDGDSGEVAGSCQEGGMWECHGARPAMVRPGLPGEPENPALAP